MEINYLLTVIVLICFSYFVTTDAVISCYYCFGRNCKSGSCEGDVCVKEDWYLITEREGRKHNTGRAYCKKLTNSTVGCGYRGGAPGGNNNDPDNGNAMSVQSSSGHIQFKHSCYCKTAQCNAGVNLKPIGSVFVLIFATMSMIVAFYFLPKRFI